MGMLAGMGSAIGTSLYRNYRKAIDSENRRLLNCSDLIETDYGLVEYATYGEGAPVLVSHGRGGGYDQGLAAIRIIGDDDYWIAPSRFGYLRTPLPEDATPTAQADAYTALLDALNIPKTMIVGISAGGPSSLLFALNHPDRCSALILVSAVTHAIQINVTGIKRQLWHFRHSSFINWMLSRVLGHLLTIEDSTGTKFITQFTPEERFWISQLLETNLIKRPRYSGILNDNLQISALEVIHLPGITVPTLVIHAHDDKVVPFEHATFAVENIPHAQLLDFPEGGHMLLSQINQIKPRAQSFLDQYKWR
jgi:pimeloyl-ACP methyl ester carboxylesterase